MKTLILGIGNTILGDDGAGVLVVRDAATQIQNPEVTFRDTSAAGLNLLDLMLGFDRVIVVDAILTGDNNIGKVCRISFSEAGHIAGSPAIHSCGLATVIELGRKIYQEQFPQDVTVLAVGIRAVDAISEEMTSEVQAVIPELVKQVIHEINLGDPTVAQI